jgi:hypothetical protein
MAAPSTPRSNQKGPAKEPEPTGEHVDSGKSGSGMPDPGAVAAPVAGPQPQEGGQQTVSPEPNSAAPPISSSSLEQQPASNADDTRALATEKPVISADEAGTSVYVVTVDNRSGIATRIERLDEQSGGRNEISPMEYVQVLAGYYAPAMGDSNVVMQAYLQGMNDYFSAQAKGV